MKIKLFEEYNDLDFIKLNLSKMDDFNDNNWLTLSHNELNKIRTIFNITEQDLTSGENFYSVKHNKRLKYPTLIDIVKIEDDYYIIEILYKKSRYYVKCDQLSELLKTLKYIKNNIYEN